MEIERWEQIKNLFYSALEVEMPEREEFLKRACEGDAELLQEVQSLLVAHEQPGSFMGDSGFGLGMQVLKDEQTNLQRSSLGNYKIIKPIGSGGMGEVFLAEDPRLGRKVAIKLLPRSFLEDPSRIYRFQQEARAASSISHPNIAHIYEIGVDAGCHFTSMEFIDGITLRQLMNRRRLELQEAVNIALQVGSALVAAHTSGIIHRDIKPENIMIHREGHIKVLDFGLAKLTDRMSDHWNATTILNAVETQPGMVMGSPAYMSPEQARGLEVDARTDIWSLGIVLYEMVTGWTPFHGSTNMDVLAGVLKEEPTPIIEHIDNAPPGLEKVLKRMLSKDKDERYLSSSDMIADLKNLARSLQSNSDAILDYETRIPLRSNIPQHKHRTVEFLKQWISLIVVTPIRDARKKRGIERILALRYVFALFVATVTLAFLLNTPNKEIQISKEKKVVNIAIVLNGETSNIRNIMTGFTSKLDELLVPTHYVAHYELITGVAEAPQNELNDAVFKSLLARFRSKPDYLISVGTQVSEYAYQHYLNDIPIIFVGVADPVRSGLVRSYEKDPSRGNIAGTTFSRSLKPFLEFFTQAFPGRTIGYVYNPILYHQDESTKDRLLAAAAQMKPPLTIIPIQIDKPQLNEEQQASADIFVGAAYLAKHFQELISSSKKPFVCSEISNVYKGVIATFNTDSTELGRIAAERLLYVNLMQGTPLSDLPIIIPEKPVIGINLSAARQYNISISPEVIERADLVIQ
jgi:serine/threonine protein kinase